MASTIRPTTNTSSMLNLPAWWASFISGPGRPALRQRRRRGGHDGELDRREHDGEREQQQRPRRRCRCGSASRCRRRRSTRVGAAQVGLEQPHPPVETCRTTARPPCTARRARRPAAPRTTAMRPGRDQSVFAQPSECHMRTRRVACARGLPVGDRLDQLGQRRPPVDQRRARHARTAFAVVAGGAGACSRPGSRSSS